MRTTRQRLEDMVFALGVGREDAKAIVESAIPRMNTDGYKVTMDSPSDGYPDMMYSVWMMTAIKPAAIEWIDKNAPGAWYRSMFETDKQEA